MYQAKRQRELLLPEVVAPILTDSLCSHVYEELFSLVDSDGTNLKASYWTRGVQFKHTCAGNSDILRAHCSSCEDNLNTMNITTTENQPPDIV